MRQTVTRPVWSNTGTEMRYRRKLKSLIKEMAESVEYWAASARRKNEPVMAQDDTPSQAAQEEIREVSDRWKKRFDEMAPRVAASFLKSQFSSTDSAMRQALKEAGWSVEFRMTKAMQDAFEASLAENVGLIRSIAAEYLQEVEGIVMRNYASGRNLKAMAEEIRSRYHVASNRAVLISRDQSNKANAVVQRARQKELGITEAVWMHSHAGKTPRPTHLAMDGKRYDIDKGLWDSAVQKWIFPGEEINCRCVGRSVLPWTPVQQKG